MNRKQIADLLSTSVYVCQYCSNEYRPKRRTSKYCSRACGDVTRKRKYRSTERGKEQVRAENKRRLAYKRDWARSQPSWKRLDHCRRRLNAIAKIKLSSIELLMVRNYYQQAAELTKSTGIPHEVDHIIPLSRGGPHHPCNLRVVTRDENRRKGARI